jgi:hypothetical protein
MDIVTALALIVWWGKGDIQVGERGHSRFSLL